MSLTFSPLMMSSLMFALLGRTLQ